MRFPSSRPLDEFVGKRARFSLPTDDSLHGRLVANLIYYQTNYFWIFCIIFVSLSLINPSAVLIGIVFTCFPLALLLLSDIIPEHAANPRFAVPIGLVGAAALIYFMRDLLSFIAVVLLPSLIVLLHALLRQRNIKTKITKFVDSHVPAEKKTPMGYFLGLIGSPASNARMPNDVAQYPRSTKAYHSKQRSIPVG
ncbi:hypothetical protein X801_06119, partial [Opisthorchis viverrini]